MHVLQWADGWFKPVENRRSVAGLAGQAGKILLFPPALILYAPIVTSLDLKGINMDFKSNSSATRHPRLHPIALHFLAAILAGSLMRPADSQAGPVSATVRVSAAESWGQVPQPWDDPASNLVGNTGDPELIEFTGNKTFTTKAIREQLMMSAGYLLGSHHLALRDPFLAMLRDKLRAGYQNCGFPEPQVEVRYDKERRRATVVIVEGKRYRNGEILVQGVAPETVKTVIERLTIRPETKFNFMQQGTDKIESGVKATVYAEALPNPGTDPSRPFSQEAEQRTFWEPGEPVSFVEFYRLELEKIARKALAQHGLFFPKVEMSIQTNRGKIHRHPAHQGHGSRDRRRSSMKSWWKAAKRIPKRTCSSFWGSRREWRSTVPPWTKPSASSGTRADSASTNWSRC